MSLHYIPNRTQISNFKVDSTAPVYVAAGPINANDLSCLKAWFEIADCSAGINVGNPGVVIFQYSPDDGDTWVDLPGTVGGEFSGNGVDFQLNISSNTGIFPPLVRYKFTAPANESYTVVAIRRIHILPGYTYAPPPAGSGAPVGFGNAASAARSASVIGAIDELPVPSASGYDYLTRTPFTKSVANDGSALDVYIRGALAAFSAALQFSRNGTLTTPELDTVTPANNRPFPSVQLAGDSLEPVAMGTGADSATTPRVTLSTRHEAVTTPVAARISDGTEFTTANETYALNTQFVKAAQTLRLPVSAFLNGWDYTNNTRKELRADTNGDLQVLIMNPSALGYSKIAAPQYIIGNTILGSAGAGLAIGGGALSTALKAVHVFDTTGKAIGIYDGDPSGAGVLITIVGPGCDSQVNCPIASGKTIYIRSMETTGGTVNDYFVINFLG